MNLQKLCYTSKSSQNQSKDNKVTYSTESSGNLHGVLNNLGIEFQVILDNLLAERYFERNKYCDDTIDNGAKTGLPPKTRLDKALSIWNSLITHRKVKCGDGVNITVESDNDYHSSQMSDGEKVVLYLIAQVLQVPENGFIVIDEPEMHLHKSILNKLWDILENERRDCIFIYLTHDLDFATSRYNAKKVWIRSYIHPDKWKIQNIPENSIPESLLLELIGSRKNILFCEGQKGGNDEKVYNILFPNFTVVPVVSCGKVIQYTQAFNAVNDLNLGIKAFGIIDSDHRSKEEIEALNKSSVFTICVAELEDLFLDEDFIRNISKEIAMADKKKSDKIVNDFKDFVFSDFLQKLEAQAANYVSYQIDCHFRDLHLEKASDIKILDCNYRKFIESIDVQKLYENRVEELKKIADRKDYKEVLFNHNDKGLVKQKIEQMLETKKYLKKAVSFLEKNPENIGIIKKYLPQELFNK